MDTANERANDPFGDFVDRERLARGLSAREFAKFCDIGHETMRRILRHEFGYDKESYPAVETIINLASALKVSPESLLALLIPPKLATTGSDVVRLALLISRLAADDRRVIENFLDGALLRSSQQASNQ